MRFIGLKTDYKNTVALSAENSMSTYAMCTVFLFNYKELLGLVSISSSNCKNLS
jgi:hypothetical protein